MQLANVKNGSGGSHRILSLDSGEPLSTAALVISLVMLLKPA